VVHGLGSLAHPFQAQGATVPARAASLKSFSQRRATGLTVVQLAADAADKPLSAG
jgi:hypothetical protein